MALVAIHTRKEIVSASQKSSLLADSAIVLGRTCCLSDLAVRSSAISTIVRSAKLNCVLHEQVGTERACEKVESTNDQAGQIVKG